MVAARLMHLQCRVADWQHANDREQLQAIRYRVFVEEQQVPVALEWDEFDASATHFLAETDDAAVATARLIIDDNASARIGRMAVLADYRGQGIGSALLQSVIEHAETQGITRLALHAQLQAVDFYRRFDFVPEGDIFDDAGIPHRAMLRICAKKEV